MFKKDVETVSLIVIVLLLGALLFTLVYATPEGPTTIVVVSNTTKGVASPIVVNDSSTTGGVITILNINATQSNIRWKGFVGNVTGNLVLQNSAGSTLYDWTLTTATTGEVYATRNSSTVTWANINCTWGWTNARNTNSSLLANSSGANNRSQELSETNTLGGFTADDNLSATFNVRSHPSVDIGSITLPANYCWNTNPYVNNVSNGARFEELILHDNNTVIYATILEQDQAGYDSKLYDFEMIVPVGNRSSLPPYYFYVEIT